MGVELRILSVISVPKLGKSDLFAATFRLKSLKLLWGTICPLRTTETVLQKKAPLRIWGKKSEVQTGSNAMNILIRLSEILLPLRSTWQMSVSYDLFKRSANFNLTERAIWVTGSTNFETEATFGWFQPQTWKLPWCVLSNMTPIELDAKDNRNGFSRTVELFESLNLPTPKYVMSRAENRLGQFFVLGNAIDGSRLILEMQLGHVCIFPHMSKRLPYGDFQLTLNLKMNGSISHGSEYYLCIRVDAYFYGWCNANSHFWIWSEEMVQLKSLCLVLSGSANSKAAYWPNTSSWQNDCSWSHTHKRRPDWGRSLISSSISVSNTLATWRLPPKNAITKPPVSV